MSDLYIDEYDEEDIEEEKSQSQLSNHQSDDQSIAPALKLETGDPQSLNPFLDDKPFS